MKSKSFCGKIQVLRFADNVYLVNGYTEWETPYGHGVSYSDLEQLDELVAGLTSSHEVVYLEHEEGVGWYESNR